MFDDVVGAYGSRFLLAAGGVGIALILLIVVMWFMRNRAPSPFVRGGRNRQPRLQVLDAAAVDARRRLVLVRRDNVEHLVMIGGPTDIVIESRILPEQDVETAGDSRPQPFEERTIAPRREPPPAPQARPRPAAAAVAENTEADFEPYSPAPASVIAPPAEPVRQRPEPAVAPAVVAPPMASQQAQTPQMPGPQISVQQTPAPQPQVQQQSPIQQPPIQQPIAPPLTAERDNPQRPLQLQPRQPERPAAQPMPDTANAADILDAARQRVLPQQRIEPEISAPPAQAIPAAARSAPAASDDAQSAAIRRDFQRVLDEEISAERVVPAPNAQPARPAPQQPGSLPRRDPEMAPITGSDAALQKEVARIFGEMSVNRDK